MKFTGSPLPYEPQDRELLTFDSFHRDIDFPPRSVGACAGPIITFQIARRLPQVQKIRESVRLESAEI